MLCLKRQRIMKRDKEARYRVHLFLAGAALEITRFPSPTHNSLSLLPQKCILMRYGVVFYLVFVYPNDNKKQIIISNSYLYLRFVYLFQMRLTFWSRSIFLVNKIRAKNFEITDTVRESIELICDSPVIDPYKFEELPSDHRSIVLLERESYDPT